VRLDVGFVARCNLLAALRPDGAVVLVPRLVVPHLVHKTREGIHYFPLVQYPHGAALCHEDDTLDVAEILAVRLQRHRRVAHDLHAIEVVAE
jgi:hypothetical protein